MAPIRLVLAWAGLLAVLVLAGCSSAGSPAASVAPRNALEELAEVYRYLDAERQQPPSRLEDLHPYEASLPNAWPALEQGQYKVIWGVGYTRSAEVGQAVLAYDKDVPTSGGEVLLRNGTVTRMTPEQFQAAPKAGP